MQVVVYDGHKMVLVMYVTSVVNHYNCACMLQVCAEWFRKESKAEQLNMPQLVFLLAAFSFVSFIAFSVLTLLVD